MGVALIRISAVTVSQFCWNKAENGSLYSLLIHYYASNCFLFFFVFWVEKRLAGKTEAENKSRETHICRFSEKEIPCITISRFIDCLKMNIREIFEKNIRVESGECYRCWLRDRIKIKLRRLSEFRRGQ